MYCTSRVTVSSPFTTCSWAMAHEIAREVGRGNRAVQCAGVHLHAQQPMAELLRDAFRRLGQHVRDHVADRAAGVVERFDRDDVVHLQAQFARAEDRGRGAV